jgi:hypothetical protein
MAVQIPRGYLQAGNNMTLYAAVRGNLLYVATWFPGSNNGRNDHFIFITDQLLPTATAAAPWAKSGLVALAGNKPFLAGENMGNYVGWTNAPFSSLASKAGTNAGQMEGVIDLAAGFGSLPQTIYIASAAYETPNAGALVAQDPVGNGDSNVDPNEFLILEIPALLDRNADGKYDCLDPAMDFTSFCVRSGNDFVLTWNSVRENRIKCCGAIHLPGCGKTHQMAFSPPARSKSRCLTPTSAR